MNGKGAPAGFSLLETVIALGIIGIVSIAVVRFLSQSSDNALFIEAKSAQMEVTQTLMKATANLDGLKRSFGRGGAGNRELERCLDSGPGAKPGMCTSIGEAKKTYFELFSQSGRRIAGTNASPVVYDRRGRICQPGQRGCNVWRARSFFWATCPDDPAGKPRTRCEQASSIVLQVQLEPISRRYLGRELKPSGYKVTHRVFDALQADQICPPGAELKGISPSGVPSCRCRAGYEQGPNLPDGTIQCIGLGTLTCPEGSLLRGRKADGAPLCIPAEIVCSDTKFDAESATCPAGGWLESINLGTCRPQKADKKASEKAIKCDSNEGRCCRYVY